MTTSRFAPLCGWDSVPTSLAQIIQSDLEVASPFITAFRGDHDSESFELAVSSVKENGFHMKRALEDSADLKEALQRLVEVLWELRTVLPDPCEYFRLYFTVNAQIVSFVRFIDGMDTSAAERHKGSACGGKGRLCSVCFFETVQHAGNASPRLYLMVIAARRLLNDDSLTDISPFVILQDLCAFHAILQNPLHSLYAHYFSVTTLHKSIMNLVQSGLRHSHASDSCASNGRASDLKSAPPAVSVEGGLAVEDADLCNEEEEAQMVHSAVTDSGPEGVSNRAFAKSEGITRRSVKARHLTPSEACRFYMSLLQNSIRLLTRLGYSVGAGTYGAHLRDAHAFLVKPIIDAIADIPCLDQRVFQEAVSSQILAFVRQLKDRQSQTLLLLLMIECFPKRLLLLRLGDILQTMFWLCPQTPPRGNDAPPGAQPAKIVPPPLHLDELFECINLRFNRSRAELDCCGILVVEDCAELSDNDDNSDVSLLPAVVSQMIEVCSQSVSALLSHCSTLLVSAVPDAEPVHPVVRYWPSIISVADMLFPQLLRETQKIGSKPAADLLWAVRSLLLHFVCVEPQQLLPEKWQDFLDESGQKRLLNLIAQLRIPMGDVARTGDAGSGSQVKMAAVVEDLCSILRSHLQYRGLHDSVLALTQDLLRSVNELSKEKLAQAAMLALCDLKPETVLHDITNLASILSYVTPHMTKKECILALARLTHRLQAADLDETFTLLALVRAACDSLRERNEAAKEAVAVVLAAVAHEAGIICSRAVVARILERTDTRRLLHFIHTCLLDLQKLSPELTIDASLEAAHFCDQVSASAANEEKATLDTVTYEFLSIAVSTYEEHKLNSKDEVLGLNLIIQTLRCGIHNLDPELFATLAARVCNHAAHLLLRKDQCLAIVSCAFLFWSTCVKDKARVYECLQKALRVAQTIIAPTGGLVVNEVSTAVELFNVIQSLEPLSPKMAAPNGQDATLSVL